ncbi:hypothetical protein ACFE04_001862 [Oxalis oulophora]
MSNRRYGGYRPKLSLTDASRDVLLEVGEDGYFKEGGDQFDLNEIAKGTSLWSYAVVATIHQFRWLQNSATVNAQPTFSDHDMQQNSSEILTSPPTEKDWSLIKIKTKTPTQSQSYGTDLSRSMGERAKNIEEQGNIKPKWGKHKPNYVSPCVIVEGRKSSRLLGTDTRTRSHIDLAVISHGPDNKQVRSHHANV